MHPERADPSLLHLDTVTVLVLYVSIEQYTIWLTGGKMKRIIKRKKKKQTY